MSIPRTNPTGRSRGRWAWAWALAWFVVVAVAEAGLYASYRDEDARFHWFTHFFAGTAAALVIMTIVAAAIHRPIRRPLVWLLVGHLLAAAPDLAFLDGIAHGRWMDIFVGHVSSHYIPGRNWTWYAVFLTALAGYLLVIGSPRGRARASDPGRRAR